MYYYLYIIDNFATQTNKTQMSRDTFEFKQFTIRQDMCAMKIGTDSVILGAWSNFGNNTRCNILDIGTGTGILSIMAAQKNEMASVKGIEIDRNAYLQAKDNVRNSKWANNIEIVYGDICTYDFEEKFDYIISNPPYFENSLKSDNDIRNMARHNDTLNFDKLMERVNRLLKDEGCFYVILPAMAEDSICHSAIQNNIYTSTKVNIITKEGNAPKRVIIEFRHKFSSYQEKSITIRDKTNRYTEEYIRLTDIFYKNL